MEIEGYPPHLKESIRVKIVQSLILHEFKKLLGVDQEFEKVKESIEGLWQEDSPVAIRDFWNLADSLMFGFKLKNIIPVVSAQNIQWSEPQIIPIERIRFSTTLGGVELGGRSAEEIRSLLEDKTEQRKEFEEESDRFFNQGVGRENDPILVVKDLEGVKVIDGNGRLLRSILKGSNRILAFVGEKLEGVDQNSWVATSFLMSLTQLFKEDRIDFEVYSKVMVAALKNSQSGIYEFVSRVSLDEKYKRDALDLLES